jgi:hypothetical protein
VLKIADWRFAEQPLVLSGEVGCVLVAHAVAGAGGVQVISQHQAAGLLQADVFLQLQRAHGGHRLELRVKP